MEDESSEKQELDSKAEEENKKKANKKNVAITMALILLGFDGWNDLEPGEFIFI